MKATSARLEPVVFLLSSALRIHIKAIQTEPILTPRTKSDMPRVTAEMLENVEIQLAHDAGQAHGRTLYAKGLHRENVWKKSLPGKYKKGPLKEACKNAIPGDWDQARSQQLSTAFAQRSYYVHGYNSGRHDFRRNQVSKPLAKMPKIIAESSRTTRTIGSPAMMQVGHMQKPRTTKPVSRSSNCRLRTIKLTNSWMNLRLRRMQMQPEPQLTHSISCTTGGRAQEAVGAAVPVEATSMGASMGANQQSPLFVEGLRGPGSSGIKRVVQRRSGPARRMT